MDCDLNHIYECLKPEVRNITFPPSSLLFHYVDDDTLDKLCSNYGNIKSCIDDTIDSCNSQQRVSLSYKVDTLEYLCTTGYEDYKLVRPCYEDQALLTRVEQCNATFTANMAQVSTINEPINTKREHICGHMTDLLTCVRDSTREICDDRAANWIYNIKNIIMKSTLSEIGCPKKDQLPTILAVSFAVFVAFIIILLAFIFIYRKIKNEEEMTKLTKDKSLCKTSMKSTSVRHIKSSEDVVIGGAKADKPQAELQLQHHQNCSNNHMQQIDSRGNLSERRESHEGSEDKMAEENGRLLARTEDECQTDASRECTSVTVALLEDCEQMAEDTV